MDTGTPRTPEANATWERHGRMWKMMGLISLILLIGSQLVDPIVGIPLLFSAMAFFVAAAWHAVLYNMGARQRAAATASTPSA